MIRRKLPSDRMLRRKLMICLLQDGKQQDYVYILVGYSICSLTPSTRHFLLEHREIVDPEWLRLLEDGVYRERVIAELLEKYRPQIMAIPDDAVCIKPKRIKEVRLGACSAHACSENGQKWF